MASKLKRYDELSQEDKDMVDSAMASIKESSNRTATLRQENLANRDAMMRSDRDYADLQGEPYTPENGGRFEHPILRKRK